MKLTFKKGSFTTDSLTPTAEALRKQGGMKELRLSLVNTHDGRGVEQLDFIKEHYEQKLSVPLVDNDVPRDELFDSAFTFLESVLSNPLTMDKIRKSLRLGRHNTLAERVKP